MKPIIFILLFQMLVYSKSSDASEVSKKSKLNNNVESLINLFEEGEYEAVKKQFKELLPSDDERVYLYLARLYDPLYLSIDIERGTPKYDPKKDKLAVEYYLQAIEKGSCFALYHLKKYRKSQNNIRFNETAYSLRNYYKPVIECLNSEQYKDNPEALYYLGDLITIDRPNPIGHVLPIYNKIKEMAQKGNINAQYYLGRILSEWYFRDVSYRNYKEAFGWLAVSAFRGRHMAGVYAHYIIHNKIEQKDQLEAQLLALKKIEKYTEADN